MKDTITLQSRTYDCTKLVQQKFGLDPQTLRKWAKNHIVPSHCGWATSAITTGKPLKAKYWRLVRTKLQENPALVRRGGILLKIMAGNNKHTNRSLRVK